MTQVMALDWSGRKKGAAEAIWIALVVGGRLVELENGRDRPEAVTAVIAQGQAEPETVVGFDFAFSFPRWYCQQEGWTSGVEVWRSIRDGAEQILADPEPPFWGRKDTTAQKLGDPFRETDEAVAGAAKSVFQIGGAGAVGTGSLRGMGYLAELAEAGFSIWPFYPPRWPLAVEIYPRLFLPPDVVKSRHRSRRAHLASRFLDQNPVLRERAAGSEDAFDAAVSALVMARELEELEQLREVPLDSAQRIEGEIWTPGHC
ncbi:MAG: hypothetical protein ACR2J6_04325 [Thermoleophilaceae bacterium]